MHWRRHLPKKFLDKMGIKPPDEEAAKPTAPPGVTKPARPSSKKKRKPITTEGPPEMYRSGTGRSAPVRRKGTDRKSTKPTRTDEPKRLDSPAEKKPTRIVQADDTIKLPSFQEQQASGKVFVWIHDTSVQPLKIYRYRIRLKLLNPLFMQEKRLPRSRRRDAFEASIPTPWSPWSEPVSTSKVTEFFLTGSVRSSAAWQGTSTSAGKVLVTVFTRCLGQRVKHTFALTKGQAIGAKVLKRVPNPAWQPDQSGLQQVDQYLHEQADFSTGAVIVDINFNKTISRNGIPLQTVEVIYADDKGNLNRCIHVQHLLANSESQKRYQQLLKETQKTGLNSIAKQK